MMGLEIVDKNKDALPDTEEGGNTSSLKKGIVVLVIVICVIISSSLLIYYWLNIEEHWQSNYYFDWRTNDNGDWEIRVNYGSMRKLEDVELRFAEQATGNTSYSILNSSGVIVGPVTFLNNGNSEDRLDDEDIFVIYRKEVQEGDFMRLIYRPTGGTIVHIVFPLE